jgi:hypothetical protein
MRQILSWCVVLAVTFTLGAATAFVWLNYERPKNAELNVGDPPSSYPESTDNLPILAYCEIANNPAKYDGKIVRVSARLLFMIHGYFFLDKNCYGGDKQTAVRYEAEFDDEMLRKVAKEAGDEEFIPGRFPDIIAVGRFTRVTPTRESDSMWDNSELRFEILKIESASIDPTRIQMH